MAGTVPTLYWFDRWDDRIGILPVLGGLVHDEELNGHDTIEFRSREVPTKGDRLLWRDGGIWREHVVVRTEEPLEGPCAVYAESSLCEMLDDFIEEEHLTARTAEQAMGFALAPTRWSLASCDVEGTAGCVLYHVNALWALRRVAEVWGGEVTPVITVAGGRVATREILFEAEHGAWRGLRLTYAKNMAGCTRTVLDQEVCTALYGFGMGLPLVDEGGRYQGGYRRKLTFGEVNGGVDWVGDEDARLVWGRWDATRTERVHSFGKVEFPECTDPATLLRLTRKALAEIVRPQVSYEVDVAALDGDDAGLGDTVAVVDDSVGHGWRLRARVVRRVRTFGDAVTCRLTIGAAQRADYEVQSGLVAEVAELRGDVAGIDGQLSVATSTTYVQEAVTEAVDELVDLETLEF